VTFTSVSWTCPSPDPSGRCAGPREQAFATSIVGGFRPHPWRKFADRPCGYMGIAPRLISLMAQNSPNSGPSTSHNALKFGMACVYDGSERPLTRLYDADVTYSPATPGYSGGVMAKVYAVTDGSYPPKTW
jgi:hypothetical protein